MQYSIVGVTSSLMVLVIHQPIIRYLAASGTADPCRVVWEILDGVGDWRTIAVLCDPPCVIPDKVYVIWVSEWVTVDISLSGRRRWLGSH